MNDELCFLSAADLQGRISRKQISPLEVTRPCWHARSGYSLS